MRVAQVIDTLKVGGAQSLLATLAEAVPSHVALTVIALGPLPDNGIVSRLRAAGVPLVMLPGAHLASPGRFWRLFAELRMGQYDVVQTHLTYANILGICAARLAGRPAVGTLHNVRPSHQTRGKRAVEGIVLRRGARRIVAVGAAVARAYRARWPTLSISVLPNAAPLPKLATAAERAALRRALAGTGDGPLLLAVGRLTPQKGYDDLLAAFQQVLAEHPDARLLVAGQGELAPSLSAQAAATGISDSVHWLGVRDDIPRLLAAADLFVSAARWEGMPVALLEAMAAGLPAVVTAVGDVPAVVEATTGILAPPGEPETLARAISDLLAAPARRAAMAKAARDRIRNHYSASAWAEQLLALYAELAEAS